MAAKRGRAIRAALREAVKKLEEGPTPAALPPAYLPGSCLASFGNFPGGHQRLAIHQRCLRGEAGPLGAAHQKAGIATLIGEVDGTYADMHLVGFKYQQAAIVALFEHLPATHPSSLLSRSRYMPGGKPWKAMGRTVCDGISAGSKCMLCFLRYMCIFTNYFRFFGTVCTQKPV